jgi:hypothetical protein
LNSHKSPILLNRSCNLSCIIKDIYQMRLYHNWKFHSKTHLNLTSHDTCIRIFIYLFILFPFITCLSKLNIFKHGLANFYLFILSTQIIMYRLSNFTSLHLFIPLKPIHFPYQTNSWLNDLIYFKSFSILFHKSTLLHLK